MKTVSIQNVHEHFDELAHEVEQGARVTVMRDGKPLLDLVPHVEQPQAGESKGGIDWVAGQAYLRPIGVTDPFPYIADDFDDPLPEEFLITPLPVR
jgi:antitoxin (DNA-binding transcriptional repressor) of toxin-antitoxin stability system